MIIKLNPKPKCSSLKCERTKCNDGRFSPFLSHPLHFSIKVQFQDSKGVNCVFGMIYGDLL